MRRLVGILGVLAVLVLSMGFAALNGGQRITLRLGIATLYRVPLTVVVFGAVILGMLVMLVAGIRSDLRVRRILRERLAREDEEEKARLVVDQTQQDLFDQPGVEEPPRAAPGPPVEAAERRRSRPADSGDRKEEMEEIPSPPIRQEGVPPGP